MLTRKRTVLLLALAVLVGWGTGRVVAQTRASWAPSTAAGSVTVTDELRFAAAEDSYLISPQPRADGINGQEMVIEGQKGDDAQVGGRLTIRAGQGGDGAGQGGDLKLEGGAPGTTGIGGDVIIGCHPDSISPHCGVDVCNDFNCTEVLFGHAPADVADLTGQINFLGRIKSNIYFSKTFNGVLTADTPATGATASSVTVSGATGAAATAGAVGTAGGVGALNGGTGGAGHASQVAGAGGNVQVYGGDAGANGGAGGQTGGTVTFRVGTGSNGGNGALNIGADGAVPSQVNLSQSGTTTTIAGTIVAAPPGTPQGLITTTGGTVNWPTAPIVKTILMKSTGGVRAVVLPPVATSGLCPTGTVREFVVATDGTLTSSGPIYVYPPNDGARLNGKLYADANPWTLTTNYQRVEITTDCVNYFATTGILTAAP
jgi:hypothetical protein